MKTLSFGSGDERTPIIEELVLPSDLLPLYIPTCSRPPTGQVSWLRSRFDVGLLRYVVVTGYNRASAELCADATSIRWFA